MLASAQRLALLFVFPIAAHAAAPGNALPPPAIHVLQRLNLEPSQRTAVQALLLQQHEERHAMNQALDQQHRLAWAQWLNADQQVALEAALRLPLPPPPPPRIAGRDASATACQP